MLHANANVKGIDNFRYIKIQLGSEALKTQTKETE